MNKMVTDKKLPILNNELFGTENSKSKYSSNVNRTYLKKFSYVSKNVQKYVKRSRLKSNLVEITKASKMSKNRDISVFSDHIPRAQKSRQICSPTQMKLEIPRRKERRKKKSTEPVKFSETLMWANNESISDDSSTADLKLSDKKIDRKKMLTTDFYKAQ